MKGSRLFRNAVLALMLLSLAVTAAALFFLPDRVPVHYNAAGEADRTGSKYENLILPGAVCLMGGFTLLVDRAGERLGRTGRLVVRGMLLATVLYFLCVNIALLVRCL